MDPSEGYGRFVGSSGRSGKGRWNLPEVRDGLRNPRLCPGRPENPRGDPGRVGGPTGRSGTGRGTLGEVRNGSSDHRGGPERVTRP